MDASALSGGIPVQPIELVLRQTCHYKAKGCKVCGKARSNPVHRKSGDHKFAATRGCVHCGGFKKDRQHFGTPPSLNLIARGDPAGIFYRIKCELQALYTELLEESELPKGLKSVVVECQMTFPTETGRDEGNFRFLVEKALGDALTEGGWIPDDTFFPVRHYTFGGIDGRYERGVDEMRLMLFPTLGRDEFVPDLDTGLGIDVEIAGRDAEHDGMGRVARPERYAQLG